MQRVEALAAVTLNSSHRAAPERPRRVIEFGRAAVACRLASFGQLDVARGKSAKALLYVGDQTRDPSYGGVIDILSLHGLQYKLVGQIQDDDMPEGMTTDAAGNLYVADLGVSTEGQAHGDIKVYPKGSTQYSRYIVPIHWVSYDIAVGSDGTMYVANIAPFAKFSPGSVSVYPPAASEPSRVLRLHNFQVDGITLHAQTNTIYISYQGSGSNGDIAEFKHARGKAIDLGVKLPRAVGDPRGRQQQSPRVGRKRHRRNLFRGHRQARATNLGSEWGGLGGV